MTYADQVLDALGGTSEVARLIEAPTSTVHSWRKIGIPSSRLAHLRLIAEQKGVSLPASTEANASDDLVSATNGADRIGSEPTAHVPANNPAGNIREPAEADSHGPFSDSPSTSSPIPSGSTGSCTSPASSTGEAEAA